ncbi:hypothetical protein [Cellulomonas shaoxiangyii]|uniref:Uncharacterized protein n=1 Tax=Cellulomonas shaoxiangyii TaxID=2566013 RepID=A0A4V1CML2_9CELL|nr:hypothetical protein [Cellulomonas shaoxiangyii]QCB93335.1 hypothetical protein E5225_06985 [Cellulomonas shaoxiangyii]TGY79440.1 hypothetical protein E5226_15515 [Cellulomonas shaoxiangyii]
MDAIDAVAADHRTTRVEAREAIRDAIVTVAEQHGEVHIADVRPLIPTWAAPSQIGAVMCALRRQHVLVPTGEYRPNGGTASRNAAKAAQVYRLAGPIQTSAA